MDTQPALAGKILIVDDELVNRKLLQGFLRRLDLESVAAESGDEALALLDQSIDLVLLDIMMPGMDGFAVAKHIRAHPIGRDVPIIMTTALCGQAERLRAVEVGANDYISKPVDRTELKVRVASLLRMKAAQDQVKSYQTQLEDMVRVRTEALHLALENLEAQRRQTLTAHRETIFCLSTAAEFRDEETAQHIKRMSACSSILAEGLGLPAHEVELISHAAPMHDVGKIGIPDAILLKPGKLTPDEWEVMKQHTLIGARILQTAASEFLEAGRVIALNHHEKWNGTGYPRGLAGEDIPLFGRIIAVADVFDALTSKRPYKAPFSVDKSLEIMREGRGAHFDPRVLDVFFANLDRILASQASLGD